MRYRTIGCGLGALMLHTFAIAQGVIPTVISSPQSINARLDADAARLPDGTPYSCYSINTRAGEEITVTLRSSAFDSGLQVARGALCSASALQFDNDNFESNSRDARVRFTAAGGRYLILALGNAADAKGAYRIDVVSGNAAVEAAIATSGSTPASKTQVTNELPANLQEIKVDRRALMQQEVSAHRAKLAAEEAERQAIAAAKQAEEEERAAQERQARIERSERNQQMFSAVMSGLNQVASEYSAEQSRIADRNARYAEVAAAAERQRTAQAEADRAALAAKQAQAAHDVATQRAMQQREAQQRVAAEQAAKEKAAAASTITAAASASSTSPMNRTTTPTPAFNPSGPKSNCWEVELPADVAVGYSSVSEQDARDKAMVNTKQCKVVGEMLCDKSEKWAGVKDGKILKGDSLWDCRISYHCGKTRQQCEFKPAAGSKQ